MSLDMNNSPASLRFTDFPKRLITASDMESSTLPPLMVPDGLSGQELASRFFKHIRDELVRNSAPPKLSPVVITTLAGPGTLDCEANAVPVGKETFTLGLEGQGRFVRVIGALRVTVMASMVTVQADVKEAFDAKRGVLPWLAGAILRNPETGRGGDGVIATLFTFMVLGVGIGISTLVFPGEGSVLLALPVSFGIGILLVAVAHSAKRSKEKQSVELTNLVNLALVTAYQSFDVNGKNPKSTVSSAAMSDSSPPKDEGRERVRD